MRFAIVGAGAVGGFYGARLARAGHDVTFIARGAHLAAMRERGLTVRSPLGDFTVAVGAGAAAGAGAGAAAGAGTVRAEDHAAAVPDVDVTLFTVKTYGNPDALPMLAAITRGDAVALTLQNGVDSVHEVAAAVGEARTLGGATYIAATLAEPGVIQQTGPARRIVFGEVFGDRPGVSERVTRIHDAFLGADIASEAVADARGPIWEKFCFLAPFAAFTGASRLSIGPLRDDPVTHASMMAAFEEMRALARAEGAGIRGDFLEWVAHYIGTVPPGARSSLLGDMEAGKSTEVDALLGGVVRRANATGVATPVLTALYAVLKPHADGRR